MKNHATSSIAPKPTNFNVSTQNSNVMEMGMDVNNGNQISAFFLLSSTLYKDPYRAIVRELVSNAIDASKAVSTANTSKVKEAKPVILNVPKTIDSDDFYVQDFGIGMTLEQVINVYGNYFASNKQNDSKHKNQEYNKIKRFKSDFFHFSQKVCHMNNTMIMYKIFLKLRDF